MFQNPPPDYDSKCVVCDFQLPQSVPSHRHYGAQNVCQSCAAFFRHTVCKGRTYICEKPKQCQFFQNTPSLLRTACRSCRLEKCRRVGMREEMVRSLPYHLLKRSQPKEQQQKELQSEEEEEGEEGEEEVQSVQNSKFNIIIIGHNREESVTESANLAPEKSPPASHNKDEGSGEENNGKEQQQTSYSCEICGQMTVHRHYNAPTCLACRSFFKRSALTMKEYKCVNKDGKCLVKKSSSCRACRMDKCVLAGMDVNSMRLPDPSYKQRVNDFLDKRRNFLLASSRGSSAAQTPSSSCNSPADSMSNDLELSDHFLEFNFTLSSMENIELRLQSFFTVERSFKFGFLEQFASLKEMLGFGESVICNFEKFTECAPDLSNDQKYKMAAKFGNLYTRPKHLMMELTSIVEIFRTMPLFRLLSCEDQITLLNYVALPQLELFNKFNSSKFNSPVVIKVATGCDLWRVFCNSDGLYAGDRTIHKLADHLFRRLMEPFNRIKLTTEEFILLRAIMFCHSATSGLSVHARQVLQREGEKYARILMRWLQAWHDAPASARRFADCMHLAECAFRAAEKLRELFNYLAMVTDQHRFHSSIPPVFVPMCLLGADGKI